eukprot:PhM_4_TR18717/c1_g1_i1/m.62407/K07359/CAMKK2; calcium/calmodulin-dependent protein kinase kinase 2
MGSACCSSSSAGEGTAPDSDFQLINRSRASGQQRRTSQKGASSISSSISSSPMKKKLENDLDGHADDKNNNYRTTTRSSVSRTSDDPMNSSALVEIVPGDASAAAAQLNNKALGQSNLSATSSTTPTTSSIASGRPDPSDTPAAEIYNVLLPPEQDNSTSPPLCSTILSHSSVLKKGGMMSESGTDASDLSEGSGRKASEALHVHFDHVELEDNSEADRSAVELVLVSMTSIKNLFTSSSRTNSFTDSRRLGGNVMDDDNSALVPVGEVLTTAQARQQPPRRINEYILLQQCVRGRFGTLWSAAEVSTRRPVLVRAVPRELYIDKVTRLRPLRHPCLVRVTKVVDDHATGSLYIVEEIVDGAPVCETPTVLNNNCNSSCSNDYKKEFKHPSVMHITRTRSLFHEALYGIQFLHMRGVIHGNIRPENLLCTSEGKCLISDAGIFLEGQSALPPPEGATPVTAASDMWAFGVTMFMALCGCPPSFTVSGATGQLTLNVLPLGPTCPIEVKDALRRMLRRDPADRITASMLVHHPCFVRNERVSLHLYVQVWKEKKLQVQKIQAAQAMWQQQQQQRQKQQQQQENLCLSPSSAASGRRVLPRGGSYNDDDVRRQSAMPSLIRRPSLEFDEDVLRRGSDMPMMPTKRTAVKSVQRTHSAKPTPTRPTMTTTTTHAVSPRSHPRSAAALLIIGSGASGAPPPQSPLQPPPASPLTVCSSGDSTSAGAKPAHTHHFVPPKDGHIEI